jgi:2,3-bisphosphoglycerate-dependent phosphoglycerate mutase
MPVVWFIRHGQSESNADLKTVHPAQSALTPRGVQEAQQVAAIFHPEPDLIIISPFLRAQQTAVPTLARFPHVSTETWPVHEFTYLAPEHYNGTTGAERWPLARAYWERNDPFYKDDDVAESFAELLERVTAVTDRLRQRPEKFIIVFSHGLFLRALLLTIILGHTHPTPDFMVRYAHFTRAVEMPNCAILQTHFTLADPITFTGFQTEHLVDSW